MSFSSVDALQELVWVTFLLEVNQVFVISVDPHVCVRSPSSLDFLSGKLIFCFQFHFFLAFKIASPGPLNLNSSNMVHRKSVVLEKSSCERHLVGCLDECRTEITKALILIFVHHVEWRRQELLTKVLGS